MSLMIQVVRQPEYSSASSSCKTLAGKILAVIPFYATYSRFFFNYYKNFSSQNSKNLTPLLYCRARRFSSRQATHFLQVWFKKEGTFVCGHSPPRDDTHASITHPPLGRTFLPTPLFNPLLGIVD